MIASCDVADPCEFDLLSTRERYQVCDCWPLEAYVELGQRWSIQDGHLLKLNALPGELSLGRKHLFGAFELSRDAAIEIFDQVGQPLACNLRLIGPLHGLVLEQLLKLSLFDLQTVEEFACRAE